MSNHRNRMPPANGQPHNIVLPNVVHVAAIQEPASLAFPQSVAMNTPDGPRLIIFGGLTPLQWMAGQVAAGSHVSVSAADVVAAAAAIFAECDTYAIAQQQQAESPPVDTDAP